MNLHYVQYGTPGHQPLIILHGLFGSSGNWNSLAKRMADKGLYVIVADVRNHGKSGHSNIMTYEAMSKDLGELADSLTLKTFHLLGHSMGGKIAMKFALDMPEKVDMLIVADMSPQARGGNIHSKLVDSMLAVDFDKISSRRDIDAVLKSSIPDNRIRFFLLKNITRKDKSTFGWQINLEAIKANLAEIFREIEVVNTYSKPALFLRGEKSDYVTENAIPRIKELFPKARFETIKNGTHWLHADNPEDFFREVVQFLMS
jgi:esterase